MKCYEIIAKKILLWLIDNVDSAGIWEYSDSYVLMYVRIEQQVIPFHIDYEKIWVSLEEGSLYKEIKYKYTEQLSEIAQRTVNLCKEIIPLKTSNDVYKQPFYEMKLED